jgi:ligand-binding sensor domain-containing protein
VIAQKKFSSEFYFIHYTIDQGLSQASVNDLIIDKSGYLWIATQDGLNRFDGSSFLVFRHNNQEDGGICGNFINSLLLDDNKLWIGTRSSGVCFYNIENNSFHDINKLSGNDIICLQKDKHHNIYASLDNNNIAVIHPSIDGNYTTKTISISNEYSLATTGLYISDFGTIWAGTKEGRLFYAKSDKNPDSISFSEYDLKGINPGSINVIKSNYRKEIWIGTRKGLYRLNVRTHTLNRIKLNSLKKQSL